MIRVIRLGKNLASLKIWIYLQHFCFGQTSALSSISIFFPSVLQMQANPESFGRDHQGHLLLLRAPWSRLPRACSGISKDGGPTTALINLFQYFTTTSSVTSPWKNAIYRWPVNSLCFPKKHSPIPQILLKWWKCFAPAKWKVNLPSVVSSCNKPSHTEIPKHRAFCWHSSCTGWIGRNKHGGRELKI